MPLNSRLSPVAAHELTAKASVCGRRAGKWGGERREAFSETQPERNAAAEPQTEARRSCGAVPMPLVTSAHFAKRNGRGREGDRADRQPVKRSTVRVGHGGIRFRGRRGAPGYTPGQGRVW